MHQDTAALRKPLTYSIVTGILTGTSFIPFPPWALLFCLIPLWLVWQNETSYKRIFFFGWVAQFVTTIIGFNWVAYVSLEFGHMPWPLAILVLLLYSAIANLFLPLTGLAWAFLRDRLAPGPASQLLLLALITHIFQQIVPTVFPWNFGYPLLWANLPAYHLAEWVGFNGLSLLILFINAGLLWTWNQRYKPAGYKGLLGIVAVAAVTNSMGFFLAQQLPPTDGEAKVLIVQANVGNLEKIYAEQGWGFRDSIAKKYMDMTREAASKLEEKPDFVLWPESAYPRTLDEQTMYRTSQRKLALFFREQQLTLITGAYGLGPRMGKPTNSIFILKNGELQKSYYSKLHLLVFGEYIPFSDQFPKLKKMIPAGDFEAGTKPSVLTLNGMKLGPQICYESLFPRYTKNVVDLGAQFLVNVTNDSWYGTWQEPWQHLYMTVGRAVEFRRPLVRATNTGISTVALADGTVLEQSPLQKEWTGFYKVPYVLSPKPTVFQRIFWYIPVSIWLITFLILLRAWRERIKVS